ncbi:MAG: GNAT family N-acetyltransferase [Parabacteroides sp.]
MITANDPILDQVEQTYNEAFPEAERRDFALVRQLIANEPAFQLQVFYRDDTYVGFLSNWQFEGFRYVEHFAIDPSARNGGIGGVVLRKFLALQLDSVILEVELPEDELARRRVGFYERQGFRLDTHRYIQPPYRPEGSSLELRLMCYGEMDLTQRYAEVRDALYQKVYGVRSL